MPPRPSPNFQNPHTRESKRPVTSTQLFISSPGKNSFRNRGVVSSRAFRESFNKCLPSSSEQQPQATHNIPAPSPSQETPFLCEAPSEYDKRCESRTMILADLSSTTQDVRVPRPQGVCKSARVVSPFSKALRPETVGEQGIAELSRVGTRQSNANVIDLALPTGIGTVKGATLPPPFHPFNTMRGTATLTQTQQLKVLRDHRRDTYSRTVSPHRQGYASVSRAAQYTGYASPGTIVADLDHEAWIAFANTDMYSSTRSVAVDAGGAVDASDNGGVGLSNDASPAEMPFVDQVDGVEAPNSSPCMQSSAVDGLLTPPIIQDDADGIRSSCSLITSNSSLSHSSATEEEPSPFDLERSRSLAWYSTLIRSFSSRSLLAEHSQPVEGAPAPARTHKRSLTMQLVRSFGSSMSSGSDSSPDEQVVEAASQQDEVSDEPVIDPRELLNGVIPGAGDIYDGDAIMQIIAESPRKREYHRFSLKKPMYSESIATKLAGYRYERVPIPGFSRGVRNVK